MTWGDTNGQKEGTAASLTQSILGYETNLPEDKRRDPPKHFAKGANFGWLSRTNRRGRLFQFLLRRIAIGRKNLFRFRR